MSSGSFISTRSTLNDRRYWKSEGGEAKWHSASTVESSRAVSRESPVLLARAMSLLRTVPMSHGPVIRKPSRAAIGPSNTSVDLKASEFIISISRGNDRIVKFLHFFDVFATIARAAYDRLGSHIWSPESDSVSISMSNVTRRVLSNKKLMKSVLV